MLFRVVSSYGLEADQDARSKAALWKGGMGKVLPKAQDKCQACGKKCRNTMGLLRL